MDNVSKVDSEFHLYEERSQTNASRCGLRECIIFYRNLEKTKKDYELAGSM